ncbi:MAG: oxygen-dependent coproporphyrinogen oxidase [Aestuariivita sp.]|nr:oxygen-dependent coproporphyrinogen oxidase [Aestuariivita sp.]
MTSDFNNEKTKASTWFRTLRDEIVIAFEELEETHSSDLVRNIEPRKFEIRKTSRQAEDGQDAGGGLMSVMRDGRVFEKVGVNISTVYGKLSESAQSAMMSGKKSLKRCDPQFWASGISLVAHMQNPHCPAIHMNTRMFWTPQAWWFGGGSDLNPCIEYKEDTAHFHAVQESHLNVHNKRHYPKFKKWADEYFFIPHRGRARGVGGIFVDDYCTGNWIDDFALIRDIGRAFLPAFLPIIEKRRYQKWTKADKEVQLLHRGLYAEYNLVYDRGTKFGLATGHDADAVLMSLPPLAKWI